MSLGRPRLPSLTAAIAGVPAGIQAAGPWAGRRQLFVRFAQEAETAAMYTADALFGELERLSRRSVYHSVAIAGRDALAEADFLAALLRKGFPLPVLLDHDGQRPESLAQVAEGGALTLVQVTMDGCEAEVVVERALASVRTAAGLRLQHAVVLIPHERASDAQLLRIVERTQGASAEASIVLHPSHESASDVDRRWTLLMERASSVHADVRLLPQVPAPTGMR